MMCKVAAIIVSYNPDSNLFDSINLLLNQVEKVIIVVIWQKICKIYKEYK